MRCRVPIVSTSNTFVAPVAALACACSRAVTWVHRGGHPTGGGVGLARIIGGRTVTEEGVRVHHQRELTFPAHRHPGQRVPVPDPGEDIDERVDPALVHRDVLTVLGRAPAAFGEVGEDLFGHRHIGGVGHHSSSPIPNPVARAHTNRFAVLLLAPFPGPSTSARTTARAIRAFQARGESPAHGASPPHPAAGPAPGGQRHRRGPRWPRTARGPGPGPAGRSATRPGSPAAPCATGAPGPLTVRPGRPALRARPGSPRSPQSGPALPGQSGRGPPSTTSRPRHR
jgi:hypothetical protein